MRLLILGLDNAGKTTILKKINGERRLATVRRVGHNTNYKIN